MAYWKTERQTYKRPLTEKGASACEAAERMDCRCRCGGALHGSAHLEFIEQIKERLAEPGSTMTREESVELAQQLSHAQAAAAETAITRAIAAPPETIEELFETPRQRKTRLQRERRAATRAAG